MTWSSKFGCLPKIKSITWTFWHRQYFFQSVKLWARLSASLNLIWPHWSLFVLLLQSDFKSHYLPWKYSSKSRSVWNRNPLGKREIMCHPLPHVFLILFLKIIKLLLLQCSKNFVLNSLYFEGGKMVKIQGSIYYICIFLMFKSFFCLQNENTGFQHTLDICRGNVVYTYCDRKPKRNNWRAKIEGFGVFCFFFSI